MIHDVAAVVTIWLTGFAAGFVVAKLVRRRPVPRRSTLPYANNSGVLLLEELGYPELAEYHRKQMVKFYRGEDDAAGED